MISQESNFRKVRKNAYFFPRFSSSYQHAPPQPSCASSISTPSEHKKRRMDYNFTVPYAFTLFLLLRKCLKNRFLVDFSDYILLSDKQIVQIISRQFQNCFADYANCITSASSFFNSSNVNAGTHSPISLSDILPFRINFSAVFLASL